MTTPADELRAAAFQLRNPFHLPGLKIGVDPDIGAPLADWLDAEAGRHEHFTRFGLPIPEPVHALAVARAINGGEQRPARAFTPTA